MFPLLRIGVVYIYTDIAIRSKIKFLITREKKTKIRNRLRLPVKGDIEARSWHERMQVGGGDPRYLGNQASQWRAPLMPMEHLPCSNIE